MVDRVPGSSGKREKICDNAGAACESRLQLRCMCDFVIWLCKRFCDFGKKERERAWRVTRKLVASKLGDFGRE